MKFGELHFPKVILFFTAHSSHLLASLKQSSLQFLTINKINVRRQSLHLVEVTLYHAGGAEFSKPSTQTISVQSLKVSILMVSLNLEIVTKSAVEQGVNQGRFSVVSKLIQIIMIPLVRHIYLKRKRVTEGLQFNVL